LKESNLDILADGHQNTYYLRMENFVKCQT
jgi:hypothetical protein